MSQSKKLPTQFAPAERALKEEVELESLTVAQASVVTNLLGSVPDVALILNKERQIVYCNERLIEYIQIADPSLVTGQRFGEAINCIHSHKTEGGCGTTHHCSTCGAALATLASQEHPGQQVRECRVTRDGPLGQESAEFSIWTNQVEIDGKQFTLFCLMDITDRKRKLALEKLFFHDIRNTLGNLLNCFELAGLGRREDDEFLAIARRIAHQMLEQVNAQRQLAAAERGELVVEVSRIDVEQCVQELLSEYRSANSAKDKQIRIESSPAELTSDEVLLRRVLGNMLKNALEASRPGETVTIGWQVRGDRIEFSVHNSGVMSREVQLQVFQRSFSTKAQDRGIGTYSMKMLGERYLQGRVSFTSSENAGTTFTAEFPLALAQAG